MRFVRANGGVIHFADEGPRGGPDDRVQQFARHGFPHLGRSRQAARGKCGIIRYDKRGHGLSELRTGAAAIADFATDLAALLDSRTCARRRSSVCRSAA